MTAKLEFECKVLAGAESKAWLADLTQVVERMEKAAGLLSTAKVQAPKTTVLLDDDSDDDVQTAESEDDDFAAKPAKKGKKGKKAAAAFEDDDSDDAPAVEQESEDDDADFTAPVKKTKPAKKLTVDDVNDACKAKASSIGGKPGRAKVLEILKKNFKTESVSELKPEQYAKCVQLMAV